MADDKTIIQNEVNFTSKGIEDVTKKVEKLETNLKEVAKQAEAIVTQFEKLGKSNINVNNINPNQSQYKVGKNNFILTRSKEDRETKSKLNKYLERASEAELTALEAHTESLNAQTQKVKEQTRLLDSKAKIKEKNAQTNAETLAVRKEKLDLNRNYYRYRNEHPDEFGTRTKSRNYQMGSALSEIGQQVSGYGLAGRLSGDTLSIIGSTLKNGPWGFAAAGLTKLVSGIADLGKASLQAYSEIETLKTGLSIISPTQAQADSLFRDVAGYATRSPYGVAQSTELVTLLKQSGVNDSELMSTLTMLGDTAGGNMEKLKRIANNYAQIVSIGKASMLDMRQFAYAGIPIFEAVSKELGVTQQALREMISDGKVTSDVIEKVFKDLTSANGIFANATEIGAKTFSARKQNLADTKQLALAEMGEAFINIGSGLGTNLQNEGLGREFLNFSENIYQGLQRWANGANIERSIENIEKREARIRELKELIDYNKQLGNDAVVRKLEKQLNEVSNLKDIEKDRASYKALYDVFYQGFESLKKEFPEMPDITTMSLSDISQKRDFFRTSYETLRASRKDYSKALETSSELNSVLVIDEKIQELFNKKTPVEEAIAIIEEEYNFWVEALQVRKEFKKLKAESFQADIETRALQEQQRVSDLIDKSSKNPNSIANIASQITQEYQKTEEYQQKQLEQQKKQWEEAKQILSDISKYQKENGIVDFTKLGLKDAVQYFNKGSFSVERDLNIVEGKNAAQLNEDRNLLTNQFGSAINQIQTYMQKSGLYDYNFARLLSYVEGDITKGKTTTAWYKDFSSHFIGLSDSINNWIEKESDENKKEQLGGIKDFLSMATLLLSSNTDARNYNIDELLKKSGSNKDFIPLWKRLLGGLTGLSPTAIDSTKGALTAYRDDIAIRNTTSGVLKAGLQSGLGVDFVQSILETSGEKGTAKGTEDTYQIDWKKTGEAVKKFAFELSNSTQVISAYKEGLQNQLSVYEAAMSDILVATENQMTDKDGHVSANTLDKMPDNYKGQLLNAFGEGLISDDGLKVDFKDGKFIDANGNELSSENVKITGNIFEFMKEELPKLREEIANANVEENKRSKKENLVTSLFDIAVFDEIMSQGNFSQSDERALLDDREFVMKDFYQQLSKQIESYNSDAKKYGTKTTSLTTADVMDIYYSGGRDSEGNWLKDADIAFELFYNAVPKTIESLQKFLNSDGVRNLLERTKQAENARSAQETANMLNQKTNFWGYTEEEQALDATKSGGWSGFYHENFFSKQLEKLGVENTSISIDDISSRVSFDTAFNDLSSWQINKYKKQKKLGKDDTLTTSDFTAAEQDNITDQFVRSQIAAEAFKKTLDETKKSLSELGKEGLKDAFLIPFEKLGEYAAGNSDAMSEMGMSYQQLAGSLLSNIGPLLTNVGLEMVSWGIADRNFGLIAAGLTMAAAGGFVGAYGGSLGKSDTKKDNDSEYDKLKNLKGDLQDLLEQARKDADYYERNLRHKEALGILDNLSHTSVNDAIIAPNGNVITTHPDDYLIATKTPQSLGTQSVTVSPVVNNIVNNNARVNVSQETRQNDDGSIDMITTIEEIVGNYIMSSKSDDAFNTREGRRQGIQAVM